MNQDDPNRGYDIDNSLKFSTEFEYPNEEQNEVESINISSNDIIVRIATILFTAKKPKLILAALLFSVGADVGIYLGTKNDMTSIAAAMGESKQTFSQTVKKVRTEFNIKYADTGKSESKKENYATNNYRMQKDEKET